MEENNHEQLEKILHSISQDAKPDKNFEQMLKVKLREKFHEEYEISKTPFFSRIWRFKTQLVSTLVLVLFSSTTLYAYNSDNVTNGSLLYPLKKSTENVEGLFATTPQAKTDHYNKLAKRRMRELVVIEKRGMKDEETMRETNNLLSKATTIAMEVPDEDDDTNDEVNEVRDVKEFKEVQERAIAPIRPATPRPTAPAATMINLAKEESPAPIAIVKTTNRKTKRQSPRRNL